MCLQNPIIVENGLITPQCSERILRPITNDQEQLQRDVEIGHLAVRLAISLGNDSATAIQILIILLHEGVAVVHYLAERAGRQPTMEDLLSILNVIITS